MLHAAEAALQGDFRAGAACLLEKLPGPRDTSSLDKHQWKRNGADIAGATAASYLTAELTLADNGAHYSCVVSAPGAVATSPEATLAVLDPQAPRLQITAIAPPDRKVAVSWETSDLGFGLQSTETLGGTVPWTATSERPSYEGATARVTLAANNNRFFRLNHQKVVMESNSYYFRDVVFLPGEVPSENVITWALDQPVSLGRGGDEADHELGTIFRSSVAGSITAIRVFGLAAESAAHQATIWRNSDQTLIGGPYPLSYGGTIGGMDFALASPLLIEPNVPYTVSVSTGEDAGKA